MGEFLAGKSMKYAGQLNPLHSEDISFEDGCLLGCSAV
jgi:hypothetical protein